MHHNFIPRVILLHIVFMLAYHSLGAPIYVSPTGNDALDGSSVSNAVLSISRAVQLANSGDSIRLIGGTYVVDTAQTIDKAVVVEPDVLGDEPIIIPGNTIASQSIISIASSPSEVTIQHIRIDLRSRPSASLIAVSSTSSIVSLNGLSIYCDTSTVDSCVPMSFSGGQPKITNLTVVGGRESTFSSVAAGSFIRDSAFSRASSSNCGSMAILSTSNQFIVERTSFMDSVSLQGGAICVFSSSALVRNVFCTRNVVSRSGGCIVLSGAGTAGLEVENSLFSCNSAGAAQGDRGGAIGVFDSASLTIRGSSFSYNFGVTLGGAVGITGALPSASITNSTFTGNEALDFGGAVAVLETALTITTSTFDGNGVLARAPTGSFGSHVAKLGAGLLSISDSTFKRGFFRVVPETLRFGGVVCYLCSATLTRCLFEGNDAPVGGGFYALVGMSTSINSCVFRNNSAQYAGGIMLDSTSLALVQNSLFEDNIATNAGVLNANLIAGSGIGSINTESLTVQNCTFRRNHCVTRGARGCGLYIRGLSTTAMVRDSLFESNLITRSPFSAGTALALEQSENGTSTLDISRCTFRNNSIINAPATLNDDFSAGTVMIYAPVDAPGTAIFVAATITDCLFINNSAPIGGGVGLQDANATIRNTTFISNTGIISVGAVYSLSMNNSLILTSTTVDIANCTFRDNTALDHPVVNLGHKVSDVYLLSLSPNLRRPRLVIGPGNNWSKPPTSWYQDASISLGGADLVLDFPEGALVTLPRVYSLGHSRLDFTHHQVHLEGCLFWWSLDEYLKNIPATVWLGQYDVFCKDALLRHYELFGQGAGKLYLTDVTELASGSGRDGTRQLASNVEIVNRGLFWLYNATVSLSQGANLTNDFEGRLNIFQYDAPALIRGDSLLRSSVKNYGWMRLSTLQLDSIDLILYPNCTFKYDITNYWPESTLVLKNSSTIFLGGTLRFDSSPMRQYSEPVRAKNFVIVDSEGSANAILSSWDTVESMGGYDFNLTLSDTRDRLVAIVDSFYPLEGRRTSDGLGFQVTFPRPVNTSATSCADIIDSTSLNLLSPSPLCTWRDRSTLLVRSSRVPSVVYIRSASILDENDSKMAVSLTLNVTIQKELNAVVPVVALSGPSLLPSCADLIVYSLNSYNLGNIEQVIYTWSLVSPSNSASLNALVSASIGSRLQIPGTLVLAGSPYVFQLNITNSLGRSASALFNTTSTTSSKPIVFLEGPSTRTPLVSDSLQLNARAEIPACISAPFQIERRWTLVSGPVLSKQPIGMDQFSLFLPSGSMIANQSYVFEFRAWNPQVESFATASAQQVRVIPQASALLMLSTGASGLVPWNQPLNLSVSVLDPDSSFQEIPASTLRFDWQLLGCPGRFDGSTSSGQVAANFLYRNLVPSALSYFSQDGQGGAANSTTSLIAVCSDSSGNSVSVLRSNTSTMSLVSSRLPLGQFLFGVSAISDSGRTASQVVQISVTNKTVSRLVHFSSPKFISRRILPQEKFTVIANVRDRTALPADIVGMWRDSSSPTGGILATSNLITPLNATTLVVKPDVFVPGQFYTLEYELKSTQTAAVVGSNRFFFLVNSAPKFGSVNTSVEINSIRRFDRASISATGWVDEDQPLKYLFSLVLPSQDDEIFLAEPTDSPSIQAILPVSGPVTLRLRVSDVDGAQTSYDLPGSIGVNMTDARLVDEFLKYARWGDFRTAGQYAVAVAFSQIVDESSSNVVDLMLEPIYNLTKRQQIGPNSIPNLITIVSSVCRIPNVVSSIGVDRATGILEYAVDLAESDESVTLFTASSSRLSRLLTTSFLRAGANVARSLSLNPSSSNSTRDQLLDIISRLITLQSRASSDLETSTSVSSRFLNVTSQLISAAASSISFSTFASGTPITIGISGVASNNISLQTMTWSPSSFPLSFGANFSSQYIITTIISGGQITDITAIFDDTGAAAKCARFDDSAKAWTSTGCSSNLQGGKYSCTCTVSASTSSGGRVSLAMLYGSVTDIGDSARAPTEGNAQTPQQGNSAGGGGGLSVGGAIAIAVVFVVILSAAAMGTVLYLKKKKATRAERKHMMERITHASDASAVKPSASATTSDTTITSPGRQASWSVAKPRPDSLSNQ